MTAALFILLGGLAVIGTVVVARWAVARQWAASLVAYRLHLPANLAGDDVVRWLIQIAAVTHPPQRWSVLTLPPVQLDVVATSGGIAHYLLLQRSDTGKLLAGVRAHLAGARIEEAPDYLASRPVYRVAAEGRLTSRTRPLALDRAEGSNAALLAAMQPVSQGCELRLCWTLTSAGTPLPVREIGKGGGIRELPWWLEKDAPADADDVRAERVKQRDPQLRAMVRLGVAAPTAAQAYHLFGRVWPVLHMSNAPGVRLVRRWLPSAVVAGRLLRHALPLTQWPVIGNVRELAGLLALPIGGVHLPGLSLGAARLLPPALALPHQGTVIGVSNYPGMSGRTVALKADDRLRHCYVVGPTGSGKSVLLNHLVVQDFARGYGAVVFDPKGDLVTDILACLPDERLDDVIVLDAHDRARPIGFNILGNTHDEVSRELTVDNVLHIFRSIWADYWGPRTDQILRAALSTLTLARAADGSAFTIHELPTLLTNAGFRTTVVERSPLPDGLRDYWARFNALSEAEQSQSIAPVLNKIEAFTQRVPIALLLGQSRGIDLRAVFRERKLLLVSLAKGLLGSETSNLLGSLLVSSLWQAALNRVHLPAEQRRPVFCVIDEAQDLMRLPIPLPEILAQARGLGLGVTMANQYFAQLPQAMQAAVLGTVKTTVTFAVDYYDAKLLERRYAPLTADDLMGLQRFEVAARCCVDAQTLSPVTLNTLPPLAAVRDPRELASRSRERYGALRHEVEAAMRDRLQFHEAADGNGYGRRRHGGRP